VLLDTFASPNFTYRNLQERNFDPKNYLNWMQDSITNKYIEGARADFSLKDIYLYIEEKNKSEQSLLLGIFSDLENTHIGNIKYEPIDFQEETAWIGILIGEAEYRGKGYSAEILSETMKKISENYGVKRFLLGVDTNNKIAHQAYENIGFIAVGIHEKGGLIMERALI
jgi:ribosomal-protein-alanine N-acetyltransferase